MEAKIRIEGLVKEYESFSLKQISLEIPKGSVTGLVGANGAEKTAKIFSIVQTARANGVKVEEYLKYTIENIDKVPLEKLLPWHKDLPDELRIHPEDIK